MRCLLVCLLLTACSEPAASGPPAITFAPDEIDVGRVAVGAEQRVDLPWRRSGGGTLRVLAVETDCGCALADGPRGPQPEAAQGAITLRLRPPRRSGPFAYRVRIYTDQRPPHDRAVAHVRGWTHTPLGIAPPALELGLRSSGRRLRRDAEVRLDPACDASGLRARLVGVAGSVRMLPPVRAGVPGRLLRIDVTTPAAAGRFEGRVLLEQGGALLGTLPIRGEVDGH